MILYTILNKTYILVDIVIMIKPKYTKTGQT